MHQLDTIRPSTLTLLDRPLWHFWTVHFSSFGPSTSIHPMDRPLWFKWQSSLAQERPLLDGPFTSAWPSTLRTVHLHPFGPPTLNKTLFSKLFVNKDISFLLDYSLLQLMLLLNVVGKGNWKKDELETSEWSRKEWSWKVQTEVGKFQLSLIELLKLERSYGMIHGMIQLEVPKDWKWEVLNGVASNGTIRIFLPFTFTLRNFWTVHFIIFRLWLKRPFTIVLDYRPVLLKTVHFPCKIISDITLWGSPQCGTEMTFDYRLFKFSYTIQLQGLLFKFVFTLQL